MSSVVDIQKYDIVLNRPNGVKNAVNKLKTLSILTEANVPTLIYTDNKDDVYRYIKSYINETDSNTNDHGCFLTNKIVCRTLLSSSGGRGIVLADKAEEVVDAPLYTVYYKKNKEYRYHVIDGKVVDVQQKKRLSQVELEARGFTSRPSSYIRNTANGYIYAREGVERYDCISKVAISAVKALGLTFGAVDILANVKDNEVVDCCVCEVNTAPGLTGTTLDLYKDAFESMLGL